MIEVGVTRLEWQDAKRELPVPAKISSLTLAGQTFMRPFRQTNRAFSDRLTELKIEHSFIKVPGVGHDTLGLLRGLGDANWPFYHDVFCSGVSPTQP